MFMNVLELLVGFIDYLKIIAQNCHAAFINLARQIPVTSKRVKIDQASLHFFLHPPHS
jgi:hypothetical protein